MQKQSDEVKAVKRLLKDYRKWEAALKNLAEEKTLLETSLQDESIATVRFGADAVRGGSSELTATEAAAARRETTAARIAEIARRMNDIERQRRAVDRALDALGELAAKLVRLRYIDGFPVWYAARETGYSEKWTAEKTSAALRDMALMLFGL